jgi:hypothetical protein
MAIDALWNQARLDKRTPKTFEQMKALAVIGRCCTIWSQINLDIETVHSDYRLGAVIKQNGIEWRTI